MITAELTPGETAAEGQTVAGGEGRIILVAAGRVGIAAVEMNYSEAVYSERPADLPEDQPFTPVLLQAAEPRGYVLARRIRDGLRTLTIDGGT